uniref:phosphotransferase family protein n=1 Tax=Algoriphagus sp. TaxID=1872435 RepID=UPI0025D6F4AD
LMEKVTGTILRGSISKKYLLAPEDMRKGSLALVDTLASLHGLDLDKTGLHQLGKPEGYVERQVTGWIKRYRESETDQLKSMDELADWLSRHLPKVSESAFLHNDFKYDNVVFSPTDLSKILAVLDWEMATVGDPFMDLGTTLAYWSEAGDPEMLKSFNLTWLHGNLTRQEVLERYSHQREIDLPDMLFYYAFATFKIGVIVQQIFYRYKNGQTKDPRFAGLLELVKANGENGIRALEKGRISNLYRS